MDESVQKHLTPALDKSSLLLLKAADLIEERGWCQNHYQSEDGRLCIIGALKAAYGVEDVTSEWPIVGAVENAAERLYRAVGGQVHMWNDQPHQTKEAVVFKLRAVALGG